MAINDLSSEIIHNAYKEILELIVFDLDTLEVSFNSDTLIKKQWIYGAINDNNFNCEEILKIVTNTKYIKKFMCLNLRSILDFDVEKKGSVYVFDNTEDDWKEILSGLNEYTLWESAIFDQGLNIFIIKPWSVGYNLLLCGEESIVKNICNGNGWLINSKYPIIPL